MAGDLEDKITRLTAERDAWKIVAKANGHLADLSPDERVDTLDKALEATTKDYLEALDKVEDLENRLATIEQETVERCAAMVDSWSKPSVVRLAAGEMTAQELRTAQAVAKGIAAGIRSAITSPDGKGE